MTDFAAIIGGLPSFIRCSIAGCEDPGTHVVVYRKRCAGDAPIAATDLVVCAGHHDVIRDPGPGYERTCAACGSTVRGLGHVIDRIEPVVLSP